MKRSLNAFILALFACSLGVFAGAEDCCSATGSNNGFKVYGEYLYWKVVQEQTQYAAVLPGGVQGIIDQIEAGGGEEVDIAAQLTIIDPNFDYKSGFRVGVGYEMPCSNWDFQLAWTYLHEKSSSHVINPDGGILPIAVPASSILGFIGGSEMQFGFADEALSHWKFDYDVIDLQVGRICPCTDSLNMRPFVGVKFASIRQKQRINYVGFVLDETPFIVENVKKNEFRGVGPSFGIDAAWEFFPQFNLTSGISGSLLYGKFDVSSTPSVVEEDNSIIFSLHNSQKQRLRPCVDANIGVSWNSCINDWFQVQIGVAYEAQYWWNQWRAPTSVLNVVTSGTAPQGDLMLYGLTASLMVGF